MSQACIISVGNELLNGHTADTNGCWITGGLFEAGIAVAGIWVVPDEIDRIVTALQQAAEQGRLLLVTGGLGPTDDDLTRQAVAAYLGVDLEFHPEVLTAVESFFKKRGREVPSTNRRQAYAPAGATVLDNPLGTAPGFLCKTGDITIAVMPGVPSEMKHMFEFCVRPLLPDLTTQTIGSGKIRCYGVGESTIAEKLGDLMKRGRNPLVNITCGSGDIQIHIIAGAGTKETAREMVEADKKRLRGLLGEWVYGEDDQSLPVLVGDLLKKQKMTLAVAESCTGGLLSKMMTDIPGSSEYFLGGWVTYSNAAKIECLGIPAEWIEKYGAVSKPVALSMAESAAKRAGADIGVGITGIAGPAGGTEDKPVGLVYVGSFYNGDSSVNEYHFTSFDRKTIRLRSVFAALNQLRLQMQV